MQILTAPAPGAEWSSRMMDLMRTCMAYPYAFLRLWDGD